MNWYELEVSIYFMVCLNSSNIINVSFCCSRMFINSSWTYLINVHECSLTTWLMNYQSSWPFMNNPNSWTRWQFMNRLISWLFMKVSYVVQECSWTVHEHFAELSLCLVTNIHELFMNVQGQFMIISTGSHCQEKSGRVAPPANKRRVLKKTASWDQY